MSEYTLRNETLVLKMDDFGAELTSIFDSEMNTEYLWNADPVYWKRHAPILFPIVGGLKNKTYHYQGQAYSLPQHGFARDMQFQPVSMTEKEIWFALDATEETKKVYPFDFRLELGYRLEGRCITVFWKVINQGAFRMYFSIGGHPAFYCPLDQKKKQSEYFIGFDREDPIHYLLINTTGLVDKKPFSEQNILTTDHGTLPIDAHLFDYDALIIEEDQFHKVSLMDSAKHPYLTVTFDAPLFGLWSPAGKNAPFICIEPWYGRCDSSEFEGTLEDRQWGNMLEAGGIFETSYQIEIA